MTTTTREVTPQDRMAVRNIVKSIEAVPGLGVAAKPYRDALYVDGFPNSYTEAAQALSQELIVRLSEGLHVEAVTDQIEMAQIEGNWYK